MWELEFQTKDGDTKKLRITSEHPFWIKERGWVEAAKFLPGDEVFTSAGGWVRVSNGAWVSQAQTVYNFEVEGFHSYFVGETGVWVHNTSCKLFPNKPGVYHIEAGGEYYTGSSTNIRKRLKDKRHKNAQKLLKRRDVKVTIIEVDISHLKTRKAKGGALRVIEQETMDAFKNVPRRNKSLNDRLALVKKKRKLYRKRYKPQKGCSYTVQ